MCGGSSPSPCCHEECEESEEGTGQPLKDQNGPLAAILADKGNDAGRELSVTNEAAFDPENTPMLHLATRSAVGSIGVVSVR